MVLDCQLAASDLQMIVGEISGKSVLRMKTRLSALAREAPLLEAGKWTVGAFD